MPRANKSRLAVIACVAVLLLVAAVFLRQRFSSDAGGSLDELVKEGVPTLEGTQSTRQAIDPAPRNVSGRPVTAADIEKVAKTKAEAYELLLPHAEAGSIEHLLALEELQLVCAGAARALMESSAPVLARQSPSWRQEFKQHVNYCGHRSVLDDRVDSLVKDSASIIEKMAEQGDALAMLLDSFSKEGVESPELQELAVAALRTDVSGGVALRAASIFTMSGSELISSLESDLFGRAVPSARRDSVRHAALLLYACSRGINCAGGGRFQRDNCLLKGWCDTGLSMADYLRKYQLSSEEHRVAEAYSRWLVEFVGR